MSLSSQDRRLLSRVRKATGAQSESQLPPEVLERELEEAKEHLTEELRQSLDSSTLNFYTEDEAEEALFSLMCLRIRAHLVGSGTGLPRTVSHIRRFDFRDSQANFWRDELVRHLNRLTE